MRAVAKAQKRVAGLLRTAPGWLGDAEDGGRELHKKGTRKLRRAMAKLERAKRAAK